MELLAGCQLLLHSDFLVLHFALLHSVRIPAFRLFIWLLQIPSGLIQRALSVVVGLQRLAVFVGGAFALPGNVKNFAQLYMAPNLGPARIAIAVQRIAIGVRRGLIVVLQKEDFSDAVVRERAVLVDLERLVELRKRSGQVPLLHQSGAALNRSSQLNVRRI